MPLCSRHFRCLVTGSLCRLSLLVVFAVFTSVTFRSVQGDEVPRSGQQIATPVQVSDDDNTIESHDALKARVRPLTAEELSKLAVVWRDRLRRKAEEVSDIQASVSQNDRSSNSDLKKLLEQQALLTDRLRVVLSEWERKGGDTKEFQLYASAVSDVGVTVSTVSAAISLVQDWLFSSQGGLHWIRNILRFFSILFASWMLAKFLSRIVERAIRRVNGISSLLRTFLVNVIRQATILLGVAVSLSALGIDTSPLLALIGGSAFVVGMALQGTLSNFAQGLVILAYRPFDVGDVVDAGGVHGIVDSMNILSTTIRTFDNKKMIVPNGKIGSDTITNATASSTRRVDLTFGIGYQDDADKAQTILEQIIDSHPLVLKNPVPVIRLNELADSSVNYVVRPWAKTADYWTVYWDITAAVKREFDKSGVSIPFPQQDVHLYQDAKE